MSKKNAAPQEASGKQEHRYSARAGDHREYSSDADRARSALAHLDPGCDRNEWFKIACAAKDAGVTFDEFHAWSAQADNYKGERDVRDMWKSIKPGGRTTERTLFERAFEAGWHDDGRAPQEFKMPARKPTPEPERPRHDPSEIWQACEAATAQHGYIARKGGWPGDLRVYRGTLRIRQLPMDGWLVIPARDSTGEIRTLQFIAPEKRDDGRGKLNLPGCSVAGWHAVGALQPGAPAYIVEGIGQAWSVNAAMDSAALVALGFSNVERVAQAAKQAGAIPVLVADRGKEADAAAIAARLNCPWVEMPVDLPVNGDVNDLQAAEGIEAVRAVLEQQRHPAANDNGETGETGGTLMAALMRALTPITPQEMATARLTPRVILQDLLYADVRTRISAGGTGKTTVALFEAVTLALGRELWGRKPERACRTAIVTREDGRETLVARLREITRDMDLSSAEEAAVSRSIRIVDLSGVAFRLSEVIGDVVYPHRANLDALVQALGPWRPDWIIFDPLVSFGVGESRVNDAEQGLIEAFRVLRNELDCCVEGIHHSGKANARDKTLDQYSGRGGSALSDGCRMVAVMQPLEPAEWLRQTGVQLADGETGLVMALPKLSYAKTQEPIYIRRRGYRFESVETRRANPQQETENRARLVLEFIRTEYREGRKYSKEALENSTERLKLSRKEIREASTLLMVDGRVIYNGGKGKAGAHFEPLSFAETTGETPHFNRFSYADHD